MSLAEPCDEPKKGLKRHVYIRLARRSHRLDTVYDLREQTEISTRSFPNGRCQFSRSLPAFYSPKNVKDTTLIFESRFESGNLLTAARAGEYEYDLIIRPDYGTNG